METWLEEQRDRLALWVPVMLGLGVGAWFALPGPVQWAGWIAGCASVAPLALLLPQGGRLRYAVTVAALLAATGCVLIWGKALLWGEPPLAYPRFTQIQGTVVSVEQQPALQRMRLIIAPEENEAGLPRHIRVTVMQRDWQDIMGEGAVLSFRSRLMPPAPPAVPGAYDFASRAYFMGIGATGRALSPIMIIRPSPYKQSGLRQRLSDHIRSRLPGAEGAIAATLATGDRGAIPPEDAQAMRRSGLAHLLSISGLHVSALIGGVIFLVYRLLSLSRWMALRWPLMLVAAGAGALAGLGYTVLTGAEVPTIRSCIAALLVLGGLALGREAISLRLVAAGCVMILIFWPEALVGPSFQMSFMAVAVIVALMETRWFRNMTQARDENIPRKTARIMISLFITGIAIELALMPIALHHFHQAGLLGAAANLIAIPLTTFVIMPAEALALLADGAGLGAPFWWVTGKALALMLWVAHRVSEHPWATWAMPVTSTTAFLVAVFGLLWMMIWQGPVRFLGSGMVAGAMVVMIMTPAPDIVISGDGRHMAVRQETGGVALLRGGAGDYVRGMMAGAMGEGEEPINAGDDIIALEDAPYARCSPELCAVTVRGAGRREARPWVILATRSAMQVPWQEFIHACRQADIVISDRIVPKACSPRRLKLDKARLEQTGGVALYLKDESWRIVKRGNDRHPWNIRR